MHGLAILIPVAIAMGVIGFLAFRWTLRTGQYEDMDGAAHRILDDDDKPIADPPEEREARR
jgi:cbb3-type cytochrome oxidase maturation protein